MTDVLSSLSKLPAIEPVKNEASISRNIQIEMLRLDTIHPIVSGNKIFKLYYFLEEAKMSGHKQIITFGGAYSNHLAATAFACKESGIKCIGFVRGESAASLSHTLAFCIENKMQIEFLSRSEYKKINEPEFKKDLIKKYGNHTLIPEGGFSKKGARRSRVDLQFI